MEAFSSGLFRCCYLFLEGDLLLFQFFQNRRVILIALVFLLLTWVVFVTSHRRANEGKVEYFLNTAMTPLESIFNSIGRTVNESWKTITHLARLKEENDRLKEEIAGLKLRQLGLDMLKSENNRLRAALKFQSGQPNELVAAEIISINPSNWNSAFLINKGVNFGLRRNMAVISPQGVVGRIGEVRATTAEVILITDPRQGNYIGGIVNRTRDMVIITGGGHRGECTIQPAVDNYFSELRINDLIVTAETSAVFPKGLPVGRVVGFKKRVNSMVTAAYIKPIVNLSRLETVYVIKTKHDMVVTGETRQPGRSAPTVNPEGTVPNGAATSGGSNNALVNP